MDISDLEQNRGITAICKTVKHDWATTKFLLIAEIGYLQWMLPLKRKSSVKKSTESKEARSGQFT